MNSELSENDLVLIELESVSVDLKASVSKLAVEMIYSLDNWSCMLIDEMIHMKEQMKYTKLLIEKSNNKK
jgi:hypothetical protein